jgi:RNA polymerase primary sigma factor
LECLKRIEDLSQEEAEEALLSLEEREITLDISDLPPYGNDGEAAIRLKLEQELAKTGQLQNGLEENDPLRLYLEELSGIPAAGDEKKFAEQYLDGNDDVAQQLVNLSLSRVVERACAMTGRGVLLLDLIQEGSLGLWQGILNYTGGDYEAHIAWWIDQYLAKAVLMQAHTGGIWQKMRQGMADYRDADQQLLSELGRNPTLEEIAEAIHVTVEEATTYAAMLNQARAREQIEQLRQPKESSPDDEQAVENTAYFQTRQRISEMLSTLTEQETKLLTLRFGLEGDAPKTPEQTGAALGLTADEVINQEAAALLKLRQQAQ